MSNPPSTQVRTEGEEGVVLLRGGWTLEHVSELTRIAPMIRTKQVRIVDDGIEAFDSVGAANVLRIIGDREASLDVQASHAALLTLMAERRKGGAGGRYESRRPEEIRLRFSDVRDFLSLAGASFLRVLGGRIRFRETVAQLEQTLVNSIFVVVLVSALIGVVVAYLFASQMVKYGAALFVVDAVSIAMCRELSPLIAAVIMAGRSGSAFTALIGTMKLNEEIDALECLGLHPIDVLVTPRVVALVIALPLLVFIGDVAGIIGGMMIADVSVGITTQTFLTRLGDALALKHVIVGLVKAPLFAATIALIGCARGFAVEMNARSIGLNTTATVVQSIVAVILINAAFAVLFVELGI